MIVVFNAASLSPSLGLHAAKVKDSKGEIQIKREVSADVGSRKTQDDVFLHLVDTNYDGGKPVESYHVFWEDQKLTVNSTETKREDVLSGEEVDEIRITFSIERG